MQIRSLQTDDRNDDNTGWPPRRAWVRLMTTAAQQADSADQASKRKAGRPRKTVDTPKNDINSYRPDGTSRAHALRRLRQDRLDLHAPGRRGRSFILAAVPVSLQRKVDQSSDRFGARRQVRLTSPPLDNRRELLSIGGNRDALVQRAAPASRARDVLPPAIQTPSQRRIWTRKRGCDGGYC